VDKKKHLFKKIFFFWDWSIFEKLLLLINFVVTLGLLIYQCYIGGYTDWRVWIAFISNIFNIVSVILATKKMLSCFVWGIIAVIGFGAVSLGNKEFGNVLLYWAFYVISQIIAIYLWNKHKDNKNLVKPTNIKLWHLLIILISTVGLIIGFFFIERIPSFQNWWYHNENIHSWYHNLLDASVLMLSIMMTVFTWLRFRQRWIISIVVDSCQVSLWSIQLVEGSLTNMSAAIMIVSSITMLTCAIYGVINWRK
jgi:nicotinamide mononucleotide transporter PnuC